MRNNIVHKGADKLKYEIRNIVKIAKQLEKEGINIIWENIGDPIQKGHSLPSWIKDIIIKEMYNDCVYAYCPTKGIEETRNFLAQLNNKKNGVQITADDIIFFNGLGDAISTFYHYIHHNARVICPSPAYSTHSSAESAHAGNKSITYKLDPYNNWLPDINDLYNKVKYNESISAILIISPNNPTGIVYPRKILKQIIDIAREFDLFVIADEIYMNIVYNNTVNTTLAEVIGDVCGVSMKGISKEYPWPGSRCGWIEFYNKNKNQIFARFAQSIEDAKMLEVCSTTLPQKLIPIIMNDKRYIDYIKSQNLFYEKRSKQVFDIFKDINCMISYQTNGAFYFTPIFKENILNNKQTLPIPDNIYNIIKPELEYALPDKRFILYLMAYTGICVVPLSSFDCNYYGFRMTLLEKDDDIFISTCNKIKDTIQKYISS